MFEGYTDDAAAWKAAIGFHYVVHFLKLVLTKTQRGSWFGWVRHIKSIRKRFRKVREMTVRGWLVTGGHWRMKSAGRPIAFVRTQ